MKLFNSERRSHFIRYCEGRNQAVYKRVDHAGHGVGQFLRLGGREIELTCMGIFITSPAANGAKTLKGRRQMQGLNFLVQLRLGREVWVATAASKMVDDSFKTNTKKSTGRTRRCMHDGLSFAKYRCSFGRHVLGRLQSAVRRPNKIATDPEAKFVATGVKAAGYGVFVGMGQYKKIVRGNRKCFSGKVAGSLLKDNIASELYGSLKKREG